MHRIAATATGLPCVAIQHLTLSRLERYHFAKNNHLPELPASGCRSTFPPTPKGKPGGGPNQEVRRGESHSEAVVREPGATGKPRAPGTVGRPDGDPSGSSSGHRTAGLTTRKIFPETGRSRSSDRTPAGGFGHRQELHSELGPRPNTGWARVPRGLRLRPRLPRDFLVLWPPHPNNPIGSLPPWPTQRNC